MYLFPFFVLGRGPMTSIPTRSKGPSATGVDSIIDSNSRWGTFLYWHTSQLWQYSYTFLFTFDHQNLSSIFFNVLSYPKWPPWYVSCKSFITSTTNAFGTTICLITSFECFVPADTHNRFNNWSSITKLDAFTFNFIASLLSSGNFFCSKYSIIAINSSSFLCSWINRSDKLTFTSCSWFAFFFAAATSPLLPMTTVGGSVELESAITPVASELTTASACAPLITASALSATFNVFRRLPARVNART